MKKLFVALFLFSLSCYGQLFQPSYSRNDYTGTPVTTAAYVTIVASLSNTASSINVADTSGQSLLLARYTAGCVAKINEIIVPQGGQGQAPYFFQAGDCVRLKALSGNAIVGENDITFFP